MTINSCRKGKRAERQAAAYLRSLGFALARRGAQHCGGPDAPDVIVPELPDVHIEVKDRKGIDLATAELDHALTQAERDAGPGRSAAVLWKRSRTNWRLTWRDAGIGHTVTGDPAIAATLGQLNARRHVAPGQAANADHPKGTPSATSPPAGDKRDGGASDGRAVEPGRAVATETCAVAVLGDRTRRTNQDD